MQSGFLFLNCAEFCKAACFNCGNQRISQVSVEIFHPDYVFSVASVVYEFCERELFKGAYGAGIKTDFLFKVGE